ncbi:hypothetical protein TRIUR3_11173 [Triticum urartu]|uniref:Uncharacterized protein n=1 Tax=Triticum urartu TaxID=4572 RepID=M8A6F3_TRIUA|nr:hypothetical protein TRIUR3_11173 [Triticum urartu]
MGYIGNKGSVSASMSIYQTMFCFVCTHLSAGERPGNLLKAQAERRRAGDPPADALRRPRRPRAAQRHLRPRCCGKDVSMAVDQPRVEQRPDLTPAEPTPTAMRSGPGSSRNRGSFPRQRQQTYEEQRQACRETAGIFLWEKPAQTGFFQIAREEMRR